MTMSEKVSNLITRAITGVIFVAIIVSCFLRPETMILLFALVTGLTMWEYTGLVDEIDGVSVNRFITTAAGTYLFLAIAGYCSGITPPAVFIPYLLTIVYLFISELYTKAPNPINNWAYTMLPQLYIALPMAMVNVLAFRGDINSIAFTPLLPLSIFIFLWTNDTGAYCSGSLFGRHKLFPRISPGKSWEGSIGGGLLVLAVAALIGWGEQTGKLADAHTGFGSAMDGARPHGGVLRHMGRPCRVAFQAHIGHKGQRQHPARTRRYARPFRLVAARAPRSSGLRLHRHALLKETIIYIKTIKEAIIGKRCLSLFCINTFRRPNKTFCHSKSVILSHFLQWYASCKHIVVRAHKSPHKL